MVLGSTVDGNLDDADEQGWMKMESSHSASGHFPIAFNMLLYKYNWEVQ